MRRIPPSLHGLTALFFAPVLALSAVACDSPDTCADTGSCAAAAGGDGGGGASATGSGATSSAGGGGGEGGAGGEAPARLQITGTVVLADGSPAAGATAILGVDFAHPVTVDAAGVFAFADVAAPYDLTILQDGVNGATVMILRGLTAETPRVPLSLQLTTAHSTSIEGTVHGSFFPLTTGQAIFGSTCNAPGDFAVDADHLFTAIAAWTGPASSSCDLVGLFAEGGTITQAGSLPLAVQPDVPYSGVPLTIDQAIATKPTSIELDPGAYSARPSTYLSAVNVLGKRATLFDSITVGSSIGVPVDGGTILVQAKDSVTAPFNTMVYATPAVLDGTTAITLPSEIALRASAPLNEATGVSLSPTLSWSELPGAENYYLRIYAGNRQHLIILPAGTTTFSFEGYAALGANTTYTWAVMATDTDIFSPDRIVDGTGRAGLAELYARDSGAYYGSAPRTFTTGQ